MNLMMATDKLTRVYAALDRVEKAHRLAKKDQAGVEERAMVAESLGHLKATYSEFRILLNAHVSEAMEG